MRLFGKRRRMIMTETTSKCLLLRCNVYYPKVGPQICYPSIPPRITLRRDFSNFTRLYTNKPQRFHEEVDPDDRRQDGLGGPLTPKPASSAALAQMETPQTAAGHKKTADAVRRRISEQFQGTSES